VCPSEVDLDMFSLFSQKGAPQARECWSTNKNVIGTHGVVTPPKINTLRAVQANAIAFGPRDLARSGFSTH